jgi:hypothetical protein
MIAARRLTNFLSRGGYLLSWGRSGAGLDGRLSVGFLAMVTFPSAALAASSNRPRSALCPVAARMFGAGLFGLRSLCSPLVMAKFLTMVSDFLAKAKSAILAKG